MEGRFSTDQSLQLAVVQVEKEEEEIIIKQNKNTRLRSKRTNMAKGYREPVQDVTMANCCRVTETDV